MTDLAQAAAKDIIHGLFFAVDIRDWQINFVASALLTFSESVRKTTWEEAADYMHTAHLHQTFGDCEAEFRRRAAGGTP